MPSSRSHTASDVRPDFMVRLGLIPPYSKEDIQQAYHIQAKRVHPDHGGSSAEFCNLQDAFEKANQYLEFRMDRRNWIAQRVDGYLTTRNVIEKLEWLGAQVTTNAIDWLEQSFGDFKELTDSILGVRLESSPDAENLINTMVADSSAFSGMTWLELPNCPLSDKAVSQLVHFQQLQHVDLSKTAITKNGLGFVKQIPGLESLNLRGTHVGWWKQFRIGYLLKKRRTVKPRSPLTPS